MLTAKKCHKWPNPPSAPLSSVGQKGHHHTMSITLVTAIMANSYLEMYYRFHESLYQWTVLNMAVQLNSSHFVYNPKTDRHNSDSGNMAYGWAHTIYNFTISWTINTKKVKTDMLLRCMITNMADHTMFCHFMIHKLSSISKEKLEIELFIK